MNILFINEYQVIENQGGVQRVTKILTDFFLRKGFNVFFIYFKEYNNALTNNKKEYRFPDAKINTLNNKKLLEEIILKKNIDIIINQMGFNDEIVKLYSELKLNVPFLSCLHSSPSFELKHAEMHISNNVNIKKPVILNLKILLKPLYLSWLKRKISKKLRFIYRNSTYTIILSDKFKDTFLKATKIENPVRLKAIGNPIEPKFIKRNDLVLKKEKSLLYVGRLNKGKRVELLLYIWKKIQTDFPDWRLDIVGDGPELNYLKEIAFSQKLNNITFQGNSSNVEQFYKNSSIFVSASAFEGFPVTLIEAQIFGSVPVVYNTYESVTDVIIDNKTGYIIPNLNQEIFIARLKELMQNENRRNEMAKNGRNHIEKFSIERIGKEWLGLFKNFNF